MSIDLDQFHDVFFTESFEALDSMESALLKLSPGAADSEMINTIFRVAHSIKGGAGMFGFNEIASFTHVLETLLDELRSGKMAVTEQICEGLLQSVDQIRLMITATQKQQPLDLALSNELQTQFKQLVAEAAAAAQPVKKTPPASVPAPVPSVAPAATTTAAATPDAGAVWEIRFRALPELLNRGNDPLRMFEELSGLGALTVTADCSQVPEIAALDPGNCQIIWNMELTTQAPKASIEMIFEWADGDCELAISPKPIAAAADSTGGAANPLASEDGAATSVDQEVVPLEVVLPAVAAPVVAGVAAPKGAAANMAEVNSIRVAIEKIDELLNTVGEIVITQSMLSQLSKRFEGSEADRLRSGLAQLEMNIRELQESVMRVRMLPVGSVFSRFPRLVRDLSARLGKHIRLQLTGEQTELDKTVLEKIGDPLVHLVRNSVDHGIELPAERKAVGKPEEGTVHLNAYHKGGSINIVITDDGRGMDKAKLLEKAKSKGLVDQNAVLTDEQIYDLIFLPGFSTAAATMICPVVASAWMLSAETSRSSAATSSCARSLAREQPPPSRCR